MKNQPFTLGEWIQLVERNTRAMLYLFGVVIAGCGCVGVALAWWVDHRAEAYTEPIREIMVWKLRKDGDLDEFLRDKARKDSLQRATEPRVSAAGYPLLRGE